MRALILRTLRAQVCRRSPFAQSVWMQMVCRPNTTTRGESTWQTALCDIGSYHCTSSAKSPSDPEPLLKPEAPVKEGCSKDRQYTPY